MPYSRDSGAESVPLRDLSPSGSVASDDFDRLLSDDEAVSDESSLHEYTEDGHELPPTDGGRHAWTFLAACWLVEAMIWGFPLAFGIFQEHYASHPPFAGSNSIPTIGTLATGMSYLGMPFTNMIMLRWPEYQRHMCVTGWLLCVLSLVAASFATSTWHLLISQGLLYGVGWVVCYTPFLFMLNDWFIKRRGLAYGILFGASGVSGLVIPLAVGALLDRFGFRVALRSYAATIVLVSGPGLFLIRPRREPSSMGSGSSSHTTHAKPDYDGDQRTDTFTVVRSLPFQIFAIAIFTQGLCFFLPNIFLPTYATLLALSHASSNALLALMSLSQVSGQLFFGYLSDRSSPYLATSLSTLLCAISVIFLWGTAKEAGRLAAFTIIWGACAGSFSVLYTSICIHLTSDTGLGMVIYGIYSFERGIANILQGPVGSWLLSGEAGVDLERFGLWKYEKVIWLSAVCMLLSAAATLAGGIYSRYKS